jgi:hypothetical protein
MIADIYFKPDGIFCDLDKNENCEHRLRTYSTKNSRHNKKETKEGWKLPDVQELPLKFSERI